MSGSSTPGSSNRLPTWFLLLLALGGPTAAGLTFAQTITQHPWQALGITLLYEVVVLLMGLMTTVWQHLQGNWGKQIANRIDSRLQAIMFGYWYKKDYYQWFVHQHKHLDARELVIHSMPTLDQIFVEPNLAPYQTFSALSNTPKALSTSLHPLPYYLVTTPKHLVLLGKVGSGKTTLLKNLGLTLIPSCFHRDQSHIGNLTWLYLAEEFFFRVQLALSRPQKRPQAYRSLYKLPFLLFFRDCGDIIMQKKQISLTEVIKIPRKGNQLIPPEWIKHHLTKGRCLILLDIMDPRIRTGKGPEIRYTNA